MSALVLDAGALVAIDRDDRAMAARLRAALDHDLELRTHPMIVAQAWRDGRRQASAPVASDSVDACALVSRSNPDERASRRSSRLRSPLQAGGNHDGGPCRIAP